MSEKERRSTESTTASATKTGHDVYVVIGGADIRRVILDEGAFWVGFNNTADSFTSPLFASIEELAAYLCQQPGTKDIEAVEWLKEAEKTKILLLTGEEVNKVYQIADALHHGAEVTNDQLWSLFSFYGFLHVTLLGHTEAGQKLGQEFEAHYGDAYCDMMFKVAEPAWREHHPGVPCIAHIAAEEKEKRAVGSWFKKIMEYSHLVGTAAASPKYFIEYFRSFDFVNNI
jgi:hypothetical protein